MAQDATKMTKRLYYPIFFRQFLLRLDKKLFCEDPIVFLTIILTAFNDHLLKQSTFGGVMTGKISDFAGVFFWPYLVLDLVNLIVPNFHHSKSRFLWISASGYGLLALLKISAVFRAYLTNLYQFWGLKISITDDLTDLLSMISIPIAYIYYCQLVKKEKR